MARHEQRYCELKCETCIKHHYKQAREPMLLANLPTAPWQKVGTDLFHMHGKDYLLVIDYCSNFPEVEQLSNTNGHYTLVKFFARHGIPQYVVSDNGPQYACGEFSTFAKAYEFHEYGRQDGGAHGCSGFELSGLVFVFVWGFFCF